MVTLVKQVQIMESETIQKNGVSPKDLNRRSRESFLIYEI